MTSSQKAMTVLNTKLKALDLSFKKVGVSNNLLTKAYQGHRVSIEKVRQSTSKFISEEGKADISTRILGGSFAVLRSKMLLFNFAMGLGIRQIGRLVGEASRVQAMETAFNTLSGATGSKAW